MKWKTQLAPDSYRYLAAGQGQRTYRPFNRRVLLPWLCGSDERRWWLVSYSALVSLPVLMAVYVLQNGVSLQAAAFAALLIALLPSVLFWLKTPVLTDQFGIATALFAAVLPWPWNLIVCTVGAFGRETVPIFAAIYSWDPVLLVGLIPIGVWSLIAPVGKDQMKREAWLDHPFQTSWSFKKDRLRDIQLWVTPWGAALAGLFFPSAQLVTAMFVAYTQTIIATDAVRLYVWAAPVLILQACHVDAAWMVPLVMFHWTNPWRGDGT